MRDAARAAAWSALWTFVGLFGMTATGWLADVGAWAGSSGSTPFPSTSVLGFGFVSATVAAVSGLVAFAVRFAQSRGLMPGTPPAYRTK